MFPASSVSGQVLSHPDARYFGLGRIGRDQVVAYARRRGESTAVVEVRIFTHFAYDPDAARD